MHRVIVVVGDKTIRLRSKKHGLHVSVNRINGTTEKGTLEIMSDYGKGAVDVLAEFAQWDYWFFPGLEVA